MAPLDMDHDREALLAAAKRLRVGVYFNSRLRYRGDKFIELFARDIMLGSFRRFDEALEWLQPAQEASE